MAGEAEKVQIEITVDGTEEAARGIGNVTTALEKQARTTEMIRNTSVDLQRQVRIEALKKEAKEVNNVSAAFRTMPQALNPANAAAEKAAFQFGQLRSTMGASVSLLGNLGQSFSQIAPGMTGFIGAVRAGGQALGSFLGILGGGPGIVLGGVVAAVALVAHAFASASEEAEELAKKARENDEALKDYIKTIANMRETIAARLGQASEEKKYEDQFWGGTLSSAQYDVEILKAQKLYSMRNELRKKMDEANAAAMMGGGTDAQMKTLLATAQQYTDALKAPEREQAARVHRDAARADEERRAENERLKRSMAGAEDQADQDAADYAAAQAAYNQVLGRRQSNQEQIKALDKLFVESQERVRQLTEKQDELQRKNEIERVLDANEKKLAAIDETYKEELRLAKEAADERTRIEEEAERARDEAHRHYRETATAMGQIGASTTIKMFADLAKGHKVAIGAVLEGIGDQMVAEGTRVLFQAAAMAFFPPTAPMAGGLAAVGAGEIAAGIALGAGGARAAGGSNAGGGSSGGRGGSNPYSPTNYADPFADTARYNQPNTGPTVINVTMSSVVSPTPEDGKRVVEAIRQARNVYGVGIT